ncbi:MAG: Na+/H+ antiporter subunit E [Gammaproteobacteria bacterium]|nr:Na+/H+ antiporter subunit E [Gammaproteobacteria bacterium]MCW8958340.1 Na+/H+ antiporter subunit E [Gammaproteobacteria bacterium]MCW8972600.1 Na+/H+ antiporter subunit E [Gammaproteobacteria bacterium]MCW8992558.1 Na+/H+ antiporter subunit E [Gammaproteobacteria bacterium]
MKHQRWLPHPHLSILLLIIWLLLVNSVAPGQIVLGVVIAILVPIYTNDFWTDPPARLRLLPLLRYAGVVLGDIVVANVQVAILILGPAKRLRPAFIHYPLELESEFAITLLASTISLTPGTVSADVDADGRGLLIHALDVDDDEALLRHIRERYERPLKEIFEC